MDMKFPAMRTGYAEPREVKPKVAVFDNFREDSEPVAHGEMVESVMMMHGGLKGSEIQRYHAESGAPISPLDVLESPSEHVLEAYLHFSRGATASFFHMVSDNLEQVMREQPDLKVVNQSQSQTPARLLEPFLAPLAQDSEFREKLAQRLGLAREASVPQVTGAMLRLTEVVVSHDKDIGEARKRYDEVSHRAFESGIVNVIAAGNQGPLAASLREQGVETSENSFRSILVNDWVTVVGGATADSKVSAITSPDSGAELYALGEKVPFRLGDQVVMGNGTSLSAPLIASYAVQILDQNPGLSPDQVEARMKLLV